MKCKNKNKKIIALVTDEFYSEKDVENVLLLCHRCFSNSEELLQAIISRFFVPPPEEITNDIEQIDEWTQNVQSKVQKKVIDFICNWLKEYYNKDFEEQPHVLG